MLTQELRYARLLFKRNPGISIAAIGALAVGIAGNSAIFSIVNSVLIQPLPYPESRRMVVVVNALRNDPRFLMTVSIPDFRDWERQSRTLEDWTLYLPRNVSLQVAGETSTIFATYISKNAVAMTGVRPVAGSFPPAGSAEDPTRVFISRKLWVTRFQADPGVIGRSIVVEGTRRRIQAVLPDGFNLGYRYQQGEMWIPTPPPTNSPRGDHIILCAARLKYGATVEQARAEMGRIADQLSKKYPASNAEFTTTVQSFQVFMTDDVSNSLWILLSAVLVVQLIVCSNVAGLLLSRAAERAQETAIRIALGASLGDIGRQCLAEGLTLSLAAGVLGMLLGSASLRLAGGFGPHLPAATTVDFDWRVAVFTGILSVLTGVLASLAPWWQARFIHSGELLKEGSRTTASLQRRRLLRAFAGVEIALSLVLAIGAGLLTEQLRTIDHVPLGFDPRNLYSVHLDVPRERHASAEELVRYYTQLMDRVSALKGLQNPSLVSLLTPEWGDNSTVYPDGIVNQKREREFTEFRAVSKGYFRLLGRRFLSGRAPTEQDLKSVELPIVINEAAAHFYWPAGDAVGARLKWGDRDDPRWYRVIGIVTDMRNAGPSLPIRPEGDFLYPELPQRHMYLAARSELPKAEVGKLLRGAVLATDPAVSVSEVESMQQRIGRHLGNLRFQALLLTGFSLFALLLAVVGVYSVMSFTVSQRTMEIGIRLAIGADPWRTLRLILEDGLKLAAIAASIGLAIALCAGYFLQRNPNLGVEFHALPIIGSYLTIIIASNIACFLPARRAALVDPMVALRPDATWSARGTLRRLRELPKVLRLPVERFRGETEFDRQWLARLAETTAGASSVAAVLQSAVAGLRKAARADSAALFVKSDGAALVCVASDQIDHPEMLTGLRTDSFVVRRLRRLIHPLAFDERDLQAWEHFTATAEPEVRALREEEIRTLRASCAALLVPVWLRGELLALLAIGTRATRRYDELDFQPLQVAATQLAFVIENGRLLERVAAEERTRQELALAARVQRRLFPEKALRLGRVELSGECLPARTIGGDYYDFLELPGGLIGIALADVAGKGIAAALLTSVIQASVRSLAPDPDRPLAELVVRINELLFQSTEPQAYATFFYAQIDPHAGVMTYVNAGHNPPYFLRVANESAQAEGNLLTTTVTTMVTATAAPPMLRELAACGPIIGLLKKVEYEQEQIDLLRGDVLVLFTDGVPEALNTAEEEYGEDRLRELVLSVHERPVEEIHRVILADVRAFIGNAAQYDDMTVLVLKVT